MKKALFIITTVFILFICVLSIKTSNVKYFANNTTSNVSAMTLTYGDKCDALLGDPSTEGTVAYYLQMIFDVMKYLGIILCIVLTIVDFFKALFGEDKDMMKSLSSKAFQRILYAVLLFFLPILIKFFLTLIDVYGTCNIT